MARQRRPPVYSPPYRIAVSGSEQKRFTFEGIATNKSDGGRPVVVESFTCYLKTGDYTIEGLENWIAIERKSLADLYGTLGGGRQRFVREMERMAGLDFAAIVVEESWPAILSGCLGSKLNPKSVYGSLVAFAVDYGVQVWPMPDRWTAEVTTFRLLDRWFKNRGHKLKGSSDGQ